MIDSFSNVYMHYQNHSTLHNGREEETGKIVGTTKKNCGDLGEMMKERAMLMEEICRMLSKLPLGKLRLVCLMLTRAA